VAPKLGSKKKPGQNNLDHQKNEHSAYNLLDDIMLTVKLHTSSPKGWTKSSYKARIHVQSSNAASQIIQSQSLLQWLVTTQGASPPDLKVERTFRGEDLGYGLIATQQINPDDTILSVPLSSAITSEGASEDEWSIHMAEKILHAIKHGENTPWLDALPKNINLPWLYWSPEEVAELQDSDTITEAYNLRTIFDTAVQKLCNENTSNGVVERSNSADVQYRPAEVAYALSLVHSRSFLSSGIHVWVPGVDLCNHNGNSSTGNGANAIVRCIHNPDTCQGAAATEEIAPPQVNSTPRPSVFELVAGEKGISKGEEVTISYGSWPNDVFLLFFGFIPKENDNDSVVLFQNLHEIVEFISEVVAEGTGVDYKLLDKVRDVDTITQWYKELTQELLVTRGNRGAASGTQSANVNTATNNENNIVNEFTRLVLTPSGIDYRLIEGVSASLKLFLSTTLTSGVFHDNTHSDVVLKIEEREEFLQALTVPILIAARCHQVLSSFATTLEEDEKAVGTARGNYKIALDYRIGKKRILHSALAYF
jgi:SET domain/Rubisco LSMT substrate-binding